MSYFVFFLFLSLYFLSFFSFKAWFLTENDLLLSEIICSQQFSFSYESIWSFPIWTPIIFSTRRPTKQVRRWRQDLIIVELNHVTVLILQNGSIHWCIYNWSAIDFCGYWLSLCILMLSVHLMPSFQFIKFYANRGMFSRHFWFLVKLILLWEFCKLFYKIKLSLPTYHVVFWWCLPFLYVETLHCNRDITPYRRSLAYDLELNIEYSLCLDCIED